MSLESKVRQALEKAGNEHFYQKMLLIWICLAWVIDTFLILGPSFYYMDPIFDCKSESGYVDEEVACSKLSECRLVNDYTIVAYAGLYCDKQAERSIIQSALPIGSFAGLLLMNLLSDQKGRKVAIVSDMFIGLLACLLILIGAYTKNVPLMVIAGVLSGFFGYALVIVSYVVMVDFFEDHLRQKGIAIVNLFWSLAMVMFCPMFYWCNEWYNILILFILIPLIGLCITSFFLVLESPKFLLCKQKSKSKAISSLLSIASYNGKTKAEMKEIEDIINSADTQVTNPQKQPTMISVYKQWKYLKIIILTGITETGGNLLFYGISFVVNDIGFNFGINSLLMGCGEIVTAYCLTYFVMKVRRKKTAFICYSMAGIFGLSFAFSFVSSNPILCSVLVIGIRVCTTIGYSMIAMIQTESFPVHIQSIGAGSIEALAQIGCFLSPILVTMAINLSIEKMAVLAAGVLILLFPLKFVPEPFGKVHKEDESEEQIKESILSTQ